MQLDFFQYSVNHNHLTDNLHPGPDKQNVDKNYEKIIRIVWLLGYEGFGSWGESIKDNNYLLQYCTWENH